MMVVALLSNLGGTGAGGWEKARMGQLAGLVEMIVCVREMREMGVSLFSFVSVKRSRLTLRRGGGRGRRRRGLRMRSRGGSRCFCRRG